MARSKFPGKPSKPVKRRRITVLRPGNSEAAASPTAVVQVDCQGKASNSQTSDRSALSQKSMTTKRKPSNIQIHRSVVSKRRLISNSSYVKAQTIRKSTLRSEKLSSNCTRRKPLESNNLVGKFVLPSRSVHSSRVIKPNKRFLNIDSVTSVQLQPSLKRSIYKRKSEKDHADSKGALQSVDARLQNSDRRIVLRQARLQLDTQWGKGVVGPFSSNSNCSNASSTSTVTCGVCGAVRFYRFVSQARKFNIFSCESCRKFISKMIKRHRCNKAPVLHCLKGQGACLVPPILRSQLWKSSCSYKARCNACWLKMCLRSFQMPQMLKTSLMETLPEFMRESDAVFNNSELFSFHTTNSNISDNSDVQSDRVVNSSSQRMLRRKTEKANAKSKMHPPSEIKRQKMDLKGPRVKHVCRSASIVLGHGVAMFPDASEKLFDLKELQKSDIIVNASEKKDETRCLTLESQLDVAGSVATKNSKGDVGLLFKRDKEKLNQINHFPGLKFSKRPSETRNQICFDFWESYDLEEVCQSGYSLISTTHFPMLAICFLCGSAGQDPLLYCCSCCEPYHPFCVEQIPINFKPTNQYYDWLCPRCIRCTACGEISKQIVNCQKCHKPYHLECFNPEWQTNAKKSVCFACMCCKSCGATNVTKSIGNTTLCTKCFKLKNKGNFCPLCHKCYEDNDLDIKMMECGKCNMWVHAKCEGLSDEQYNILSTLPDQIEYLCCLCESSPYWRKAVANEFQSCFNKIFKLLCRNKVARAILKWNPLHFKSPTARKLQFTDAENEANADISQDHLTMDLNDIEVQSNVTNIEGDSMLENNESNVLKTPSSPSLTSIRNKINCQDFFTLREFNVKMEEIISNVKSSELSTIYYSILREVVPWFDPLAILCDNVDVSSADTSRCNNELPQNTQDFKYRLVRNIENDTRMCVLCKDIGDGLHYKEARLLYCGNNEWIHANCAIWSSEVYEEIDGSLQNVHAAITRGRLMSCTLCKLKGASIGCCSRSCSEIYHFSCAYNNQCYFMHDKTFYCQTHYRPGETSKLSPSEFVISRSVYVELDQRKKRYTENKEVQFMVGSLTITCLGVILPQVSDNHEALIPINMICRRLFWSTNEPWKLVPYIITTSIINNEKCAKVAERNFTVDHSLSSYILEEKLKEVYTWQKDVDSEEDEEEPQTENAPDLLSPELTDAILEELPHGVLDRISVQDIFPKLMNDELLGLDFRVTDVSNTGACISGMNKKVPLIDEEIAIGNQKNSGINLNKFSNLQNRQQCSIRLSCKVGNSLKSTSKTGSKTKNLYLPLVQVDGAYDSSSDSDSVTQDEDFNTTRLSDEPVTCQRCQCTYRTEASYTRHLETCDVIMTSDSDSDGTDQPESIIPTSLVDAESETISVMPTITEEPYVLCSYESYTSYKTAQNCNSSVVNTQTLAKSNFVPEQMPISNEEYCYSNFQNEIEQKPTTLYDQNSYNTFSINPLTCESSQITVGSAQALTFNQHSANQVLNHNSIYVNKPNCNQSDSISILQPTSLPINSATTLSINAATPLHFTHPIEIQSQQQFVQSIPIQQEVSPIINITPQNHITLGTTKLLPNQLVAISQNMLRPSIHTVVAQKTVKPRGRPRSLAIKKVSRPTVFVPQGSSVPPVVIHQISSGNMIPTFLESFQQQTGQSLQFVTSITPQITSVNQPHLMQFQPENTVVNLLPGMQPTVILPQPQVISDQIIVDNTNSLMWQQQPLQTIQPVLYGYETIVQNTVLQSQQFLPSTVPGILTSNSSFSSTTQVFQSSKLEPVVDVTPGNYVLVNTNPLVNTQTVSVPQHVVSHIPPTQTVSLEQKPSVINRYVQASVTTSLPKEMEKSIPNLITKNRNVSENNKITKIDEGVVSTHTVDKIASNSINLNLRLSTSSSIPETPIPTNVVAPIPKVAPTAMQARPMNRVLPMPTKSSRTLINKCITKSTNETSSLPEKLKGDEKLVEKLLDDLIKPCFKSNMNTQVAKVEVLSNIKKQLESELYKAKLCNLNEIMKDTETSQIDSSKLPTANVCVVPSKELVENPPNHNICYKAKLIEAKSEPLSNDCFSLKTKSAENLNEKVTKIQDKDVTEKTFEENMATIKEEAFIVAEKTEHLIEENTTLKEVTNSSDTKFELLEKINNTDKNCMKVMQKSVDTNEPQKSVETLTGTKTAESLEKLLSLCDKGSYTNVKTESSKGKNIVEKLAINNKNICIKSEKHQQNPENMVLYSVETLDGFHYSSTSLADLWSKIIDSVQAARLRHDMLPLPPTSSLDVMGELQLLGLKVNSLKYLLEQLPGASKCTKYKPQFGFKKEELDSEEEDLKFDICQGTRSVGYTRSHDPSDMFGWLASKHRKPMWDYYSRLEENTKRGVVMSLPMAMKFRNLKLTSKHSVGVYRSKIHRRGLFCHRDIESGDMVIEYAGEVIRSILADQREKQYIAKGMGCYMFRIDENFVVDATMKGNAARFINHSCEPNCYSKVIEVLGHKHIVIFAHRKIGRGEELTYDYKFPFEEDKIPCTCGSRRCRKFLN